MSNFKDFNHTQVLIVGAGPAGLSAAIKLKALKPQLQICVLDKAPDIGNHNLSGAVIEPDILNTLLDDILPQWKDSEQAKEVLANVIDKDDIMFFLGKKIAFNIYFAIKIAAMLGLGQGKMIHLGDYSISISALTRWLGKIASDLGVEIFTGFSVQDIILNKAGTAATAVKLVDQGLDKHRNRQPNFVEGEIITADFIILAEGCDGLVTETFVKKAGLRRQNPQLFSVGVKELIKVSPEQYKKFTSGRVVHAMGYPLWTPLLGPAMFGGGIIYAGQQDHIAVGMIVGADWKYSDFNPEDALVNFKNHSFVKQFIEGGTVVEAGAKMIPEGGYYAILRDPAADTIGKGNVMILGDSAGFVNMLKIKGLHNAIESGILAAEAVAKTIDKPASAASVYTDLVVKSNIEEEMFSAKNYRQTIVRFGMLLGMPLSVLAPLLPRFTTEEDYLAMTETKYRLKPRQSFDKDTFTAMAATKHREDQPSHLSITDPAICQLKCKGQFNQPCVIFCPAGVYENIHDEVKPANPSNCVHCKTCQRKCPFDNIRWTVPEGAGGPRYKRM